MSDCSKLHPLPFSLQPTDRIDKKWKENLPNRLKSRRRLPGDTIIHFPRTTRQVVVTQISKRKGGGGMEGAISVNEGHARPLTAV
jgi:hypothetical protein